MLTYFLIYFVVINFISAYLMYVDKRRAIQNVWRVPESNLLFLCIMGGFLGTFCVMKYARHKTQHWQFHVAVIISGLIWLIGLPLLWWLNR